MSPPLPSARGRPGSLFLLLRATLSVLRSCSGVLPDPDQEAGQGSDVPWLIAELGVFAVVVAVQVPAIIKARHPVLRAVEALAILVPVYLLIFARIYLSGSLGDPSAFTQPLDNTTALYFTVTVFATVGFGDIVAHTNGMRLVVTLQMLLNLVILGVVIRLLTASARQGVARRRGQADLGEPGRLGD